MPNPITPSANPATTPNAIGIETYIRQEEDLGKIVTTLMGGRLNDVPDHKEYIKQLDPKLHDVMDPNKRPNKVVNVDPDSPEYGSTRSINVNAPEGVGSEGKVRIEQVARIALAFQKLIVKRSVGITFGNPVKYKATPDGEAEKALYDAVQRVLKDCKEQTLNRKAARQLYGMTEVAERWYVTESKEPHTNYSKNPTNFKLRTVLFSPRFGDTLYPYFDENRDMTAFSRLFSRKMPDGTAKTYFETYTAESFYMWEADGDRTASAKNWQMVEGYPKPNPFGKIPVIYGCQDEPEYEDVESLIARMEKLLSNFADTNDYHASPKIKVKGRVNSFCKKGEAGAILELDPDADADYLEWSHAPESIKQEYNTLKELIHTLTQTPDISWDSVKGTNVSGVALKLMFMDSVLKVKDKEEIWLDYLTRRVNLIKAILAVVDQQTFSQAASSLFIEPEIVPYIVIDEKERADIEMGLSGNKQLKSRKTAMRDLGIDNVEEEAKAIEEEEEAANAFTQGEPTFA